MRRGLYIFVEGVDDERLFDRKLCRVLKKGYAFVRIIQYAQLRKKKLKGFVRTCKQQGHHYVVVGDFDKSWCLTTARTKAKRRCNDIDFDNVVIAVSMIESWYAAGLSEAKRKELGIKIPKKCEEVTKVILNNAMPKSYISRIEFLNEILQSWTLTSAKRNSASLSYLLEKPVTL